MEKEEKSENIVEEEKKKSNVLINILILLGILIVSVIMYAKYVGTSGLFVHEYRVQSEELPLNFSGVKLVYFSDILYGSTVRDEELENIVDEINLRKVDIVLFGGGLISDGFKISDKNKESIVKSLSKIEASLGKYAVIGGSEVENYEEIMSLSGFQVLNNNFEFIYNKDVTPICLVGVGSYNIGSYDLNSSFNFYSNNPTCYTIVFTHEGDIIEKIMALENKPNLILAGNSLGGEIHIPFYGPLAKFDGSKKYFLDYYSDGKTDIYISSGIGTKEYDSRLFNRPSINFFRLKSYTKN